MGFSLYMNDYKTERIFSYLRWIFFAMAITIFYFPPLAEILQFESGSFPYLVAVGATYMLTAQIALSKMRPDHKYFPLITKIGILFDFIALFWLLYLTGGVMSYLFPITYLFVMHATIYWRTKGFFISSASATAGYSGILLMEMPVPQQVWFVFLLNTAFVWIVGLFGAMLVLRERKHIKQKNMYQQLVVTDYLTGLYNHRHFQEHIRHLREKSIPFSLIMGDIDHFKSVNDRYGHLVGDEVLREIGKMMNDFALKYDGQAFRYGGEEFALVLRNQKTEQLQQFFTEFYEYLNKKKFTNNCLKITMSFGIAGSKQAQTSEDVISEADKLLYMAKRNGKNQARFDCGTAFCNSSPLPTEAISS
ncbi:GGDEF domain-containing protein [Bacillus canaveralius]|uniref:GGDEF domain-containing protein n=1 Tax=Bacillus canaveralius TaxID=1403243 RepID=UPI000F79CCC7|nr:GGDEF domain-containing protein [Bacillus canaveralius]RSK47814.1 diguanylate cyclase [Bacillus canaveralius]